jgi:cell division protein FtsZ
MNIRLQLPKLTDLRPRITVIGVGGAGGNAINNMIASGLQGVDFVVANTDAQALATSSAEHRIQLGVNLTEGLGAGSKPEIGEAAAEEALDEIRAQISGSHMVFIAAGMGGGTGTGAAGVIARLAKEAGILTVGVVTKPFQFEGARRMRVAEAGIGELKKHVDTLIVIPNQNLFRISNEKTTFAEAFVLADQVLYSGIACIVDLIVKEGLINLDFADVRTVMSGMGTAMMGTGEASGERRALLAAEEAIANPLLDDVSLRGARGLLLSITGGKTLTLYEVDEAASRVRQEVDSEANIIVGATFDDKLEDKVRVSIVASGMARAAEEHHPGSVPMPPIPTPLPTTAARGQPGALSQLELQPPRNMAQVVPANAPQSPAAAGAMPAAWDKSGPIEQIPLAEALQQMGAAAGAAPLREAWRGPGDVLIETGLPPLGARPAPHPPRPAEPPRGMPQPFAPAAPAEIKRPQRRMPDVGDFPEVGQREYLAKAGAAHEHAVPPPLPASGSPRIYNSRPEPKPRKRGLFARITGRGRREAEAPRHDRDEAARDHDHLAPGGTQASGSRGGEAQRRVPHMEQVPAELPVFFRGERK